MPAYDDTNIFAKILRGEIPSYKIHEDQRTFAFLDIMPMAWTEPRFVEKVLQEGIVLE